MELDSLPFVLLCAFGMFPLASGLVSLFFFGFLPLESGFTFWFVFEYFEFLSVFGKFLLLGPIFLYVKARVILLLGIYIYIG